MSEMQYETSHLQKNDQVSHLMALKHALTSFLWSIPEPAAHSAALQLLRMGGNGSGLRRLDKSFAICIGLIGLAVLEEMI